MRAWSMVATMVFGGTLAFAPSAEAIDAKKKAEAQAAIRKETQTTLSKRYKAQPAAKAALQKAAGYAAFDNFGMNLFVMKNIAPEVSLNTVYWGVMPFVISSIVKLLLLTFFPILVLWLPQTMG